MDGYNLFEGSPVFGDLLSLSPNVDLGVYGGQDGSPVKSSQLIQVHEESGNLQNGLLGPDFGWMDSKVDLLQFLTGEEVAPLDPVAPAIVEDSIVEADSAIAVEILKSVAEDTTKMLDSGSEPTANESSSQDNASVDWFDVLDEEVSQALAGYVVAEDSSSVLSPVTAEDVESILSSGASSPSQEMETIVYTDWASPNPVSSSSPSHDTMETCVSIDWASVAPPVTPGSPDSSSEASVFDEVSISQSDLDSLLAQVKRVPNDHSYPAVASPDPSEEPSISSSNSRSKPYSRKNASKTSNKQPKESKNLDRHERKKQQNKDAALRYRLKKKQEADVIGAEVDVLEERNTKLKDTVDQMTREIKYLKNLLADVYKAKGYLKSQ